MAVLGDITFGGVNDSAKDSFGILYFNQNQNLAKKQVKDGGVSGNGFADQRINSNPELVELQHQQNGGEMSGLNLLPYQIITDTHFGYRGRIGRLIYAMQNTNKHIGIGVDQDNTALLLLITDNNKFRALAYGKNGTYIISIFDSEFNGDEDFMSVKNIAFPNKCVNSLT